MSKTKSSSTSLKLVANAGQFVGKKAPSSKTPAFAEKLARAQMPVDTASELVAEQAGLEFDQQHASQHQKVRLDSENANARFKVSETKLDKLDKKLAATPSLIKSALFFTGKDAEKVDFKDWKIKDIFLVTLILTACFACLGLGAVNVYANLMSSGNVVFIEQPSLAMMLSALLPIGSLAIKFVSNFFYNFATRRIYTFGVYGLALISLVVWAALFAQQFNGAAGDINWDSLGDSSSKGSMLVFVQLALEMLVGAALFLAAEEIYSRYSPEMYLTNLEYEEVDKERKKHLESHEKIRKERAELHGRLVSLDAQRQATINESVANYLHLASRYANASDLTN